MGSTRLPGKVLRQVGGTSLLELLLLRLNAAKNLDQVIVATSTDPRNEPLVALVRRLGFHVFRGSENDVLDRFLQAARQEDADLIVRITGDCPLVDPAVVDLVVETFEREGSVDYVTNTLPPTYPDGLDVEVISRAALEAAAGQATRAHDREHVTPFIRDSDRFRKANVAHDKDHSGLRWTVDEEADLRVVSAIFSHFHPRTDFGWLEVLDLLRQRPDLFVGNDHLNRNEGAIVGTGQKLWKRAKEVIPGGNMLLSKRAEMFLPEQWPAYFSRATGCRVWDLDGREFLDMSIMGIGTNTLGYGHPEVDDAVRATIAAGNMATFNCPEEVYLAERLVELHPWADMVRFARSGGEADAIAIRIARTASRRDAIAVCGYHGWHDWYLAANLGEDDDLAGHLLPGLEPAGVPHSLRGTVFPFEYNDLGGLMELIEREDIGAIMMEVERNQAPRDEFLQEVRRIATEHDIVLIFDECTSGFRQTFGGLHKLHAVEPDMAVFAKALGNGYAISAVIGRRDIMQAAQKTFISSTFWTERIGPSAALKVLEVMERTRSWERITETGREITRRWRSLADRHGLTLTTSGLPALTSFAFPGPSAVAYKTLITQEMLKSGYLAGTSVYVCTEHSPAIIDGYFEALDPVFETIRQCEDGRDVESLLDGPMAHSGFRRLN